MGNYDKVWKFIARFGIYERLLKNMAVCGMVWNFMEWFEIFGRVWNFMAGCGMVFILI